MKVEFTDKLENNNVITVSSKNKNANIYINNILNIITESASIKNKCNILSPNINEDIVFDLRTLKTIFINAFIYRITQGIYSFDKYKTKKNIEKKIIFYVPQISNIKKQELLGIIESSNLTRDIVNEPSNIFTPDRFSKNAISIFKNRKYIDIKVFDDKMIKKLGLNLVYAIGGFSENRPRFLIIDYKPPNYKKTISIVGKGVTIDTGGYSVKVFDHMNNMHMDKEGASICIGLVDALSKSNYDNRIVCICPLVENTISSDSTKPNDIITAYNGQTVEIIDVDAEGRLILADALAYTCKIYKPDYILDFATLTGWSENINCHTSFTHFTTNEKLANGVIKYGNIYAERSYRIPAWLEYMEYIRSNVADVKNYGFGCKNSDGFMASLFLMNFIPHEFRNKWIHFDIRLSSYNNNVNVADGFATFLAIIKNI